MFAKKFFHKAKNATYRKINEIISALAVASSNLRKKKNKKIFVYTDSRGFCYDNSFNYGDVRKTYIGRIAKEYFIEYKIAEEKYTTLIDFLLSVRKNKVKYDYVILHCGIVDFCNRGKGSYDDLVKCKVNKLKQLNIPLDEILKTKMSDCIYEGEQTKAFISKENLLKYLIPELVKINNLIYIGINPVLLDWRGTYWRDRPDNINEQLICDRVMREKIKNSVDLSAKDKTWVMAKTVDNVHLNSCGHNDLYLNLKKIIK